MWRPPVTCPQELRKRTRRNGRQQAENHHRYHRRSRRIHREAASSSPGPLQTPLRALSFTAAGHTASPSPGHAAPGHGIGVPWPPDEFGQPHQRLQIRSRSKAHEEPPPPFTTTPPSLGNYATASIMRGASSRPSTGQRHLLQRTRC